jgi:hypothetical protein
VLVLKATGQRNPTTFTTTDRYENLEVHAHQNCSADKNVVAEVGDPVAKYT